MKKGGGRAYQRRAQYPPNAITPMKTPNHPAMMYQDTVTAAALPGLCGHHGSDSSGQPNRLEIKLQTIRVRPT